MTHWHDTLAFDRLVADRVNSMRSDVSEATHYCKHFTLSAPSGVRRLGGGGLTYFMHGRAGRTWLMCEKCCRHNVELELLTPPPGGQTH
jgi:hypothetical protein